MKPLPRTYDAQLSAAVPDMPLSFLRALAYQESSFNPRNVTERAHGLLQVTPEPLADYNAVNGTAWSLNPDMFDVEKNAAVFAFTANRIRRMLASHGIAEDWRSPQYVRLFLAGWNSGWSEVGGLGKVLTYLQSKGIPISVDNVFIHAKAAGATANLQTGNSRGAAKYRWQADTAAKYAGDAAYDDPLIAADLGDWATKRISQSMLAPSGVPVPPPESSSGRTGGGGGIGLLLLLVLVAAGKKRR